MLWWTNDLVTGIEEIDQEHQSIFKKAEEIIDFSTSTPLPKIKDSLGFLLQYVNRHFQHEESLMVQTAYPQFALHKQHHQMIGDELNKVIQEIALRKMDEPSLDQLKLLIVEWLALHIHEDDKKFADYFRNHPLYKA